MFKKILLIAALCVTVTCNAEGNADIDCKREARTVYYNGQPELVYVWPGQTTQIVFPVSRVFGAKADDPDGITIRPSKHPNKITIDGVTDELYSSVLTVDSSDGETFLIQLVARKGCADRLVTLEHPPLQDASKLATDSQGRLRDLMWYLLVDKVPSGYRENTFTHLHDDDRLVFQRGSIKWYLKKQVIGQKYTGSVYTVVNEGRTGYRIAIESIDFSDDRVKNSLGKVRKISMLPVDRRLGPAPEFISEVFASSNRGEVYIVAETGDSEQ